MHDSAFQEELDIEMSSSEDDGVAFFSPVSQLSPEKTQSGEDVVILFSVSTMFILTISWPYFSGNRANNKSMD